VEQLLVLDDTYFKYLNITLKIFIDRARFASSGVMPGGDAKPSIPSLAGLVPATQDVTAGIA